MNFYFGHIHRNSSITGTQTQLNWLSKTIFPAYKGCITHHNEDGFSLTLVNDPHKLCPYQSNHIYITDDFVCATDCLLYNKAALASELGIDADSANEVFFVCARLKWGEAFPDRFDGKFSFLIWDRNQKTLLAGLDALGYGSFSYSQAGGCCYVSSDLATLMDQPRVDKAINLKRFYQCFRHANNTPEQTYFQHCHYCPPGHVINIDNDQIRTVDYWRLVEKKSFDTNTNELDYAKAFVANLKQSLNKEINEKDRTGLMLSGGLDSNLLAAVLAEKTNWKNNLTCYSYTFEKFSSCDESELIRQTLNQLGLQGKLINCDHLTGLSDLETRTITLDVINIDMYSSLPETLFKAARAENVTLMINGLFGDDLFGGAKYMYADLLRKRQYSVIARSLFNAIDVTAQFSKFVNFGLRPLLPLWVKKMYRLARLKRHRDAAPLGIRANQINTLDHADLLHPGESFQREKLLKVVYYGNSPEALYFYRKLLYLKYHLNCLIPYYTKSMIELMWRAPEHFLESKGRLRGVQVNALKLLGLTHIAERVGKTGFFELIEIGISRQLNDLAQTIEGANLISNKLLTADQGHIAIKKAQTDPTDLVNVILMELWWNRLLRNKVSYNQPYKEQNPG